MRRKNSDWIQAYLDYTKEMEAPDAFHFWTAIATIAGALRRRVYIPFNEFQWYVNFFILLVGPPGIVKKTTSIDIGKNLLKEIPYIKLGPDIVTWESFLTSLSNSRDDVEEANGCDIIERVMEPACAMSIFSGELGNFLDPQNKQLVNAMTALWDGKTDTFSKETKTQGNDDIQNPFVSMIGCTTPGWMQDNYAGNFVSWGFSSRVIVIYRDKARHRVAYPGMGGRDESAEDRRKALIEDLRAISYLQGAYKLTPDAITLGTHWYETNYDRMEELTKAAAPDVYLQNFLARKQVHVHKVAMVMAAAKRDELIITDEDLDAAIKEVDKIEIEMQKIFNRHVQVPSNNDAQIVLAILIKYGNRVQEKDIYLGLSSAGMTRYRIEEGIKLLMKAELVHRIVQGSKTFIERAEDERE